MRRRVILVISVLLLLTGVVFIAAGRALGQDNAVLGKAIFICMECIGIG